MFKRILIAVDVGAPGYRAVTAGAELRGMTGAKVRLIHVVRPPVLTTAMAMPAALEDEAHRIEGAREMLRRLYAEFGAGADVSDVVLEGRAADRIVEEARAWRADVIVVGDRDWGTVARFMLGSTADAVVRRAPCPVLVVRRQEVGEGGERASPAVSCAGGPRGLEN